MIKQFLLLLLFTMCTYWATAQQTDSLKLEIVKCTTDSCKHKLTHTIARIYLRSDVDSAAYYGNLSRDFAEKMNDPSSIIKNLFIQQSVQSQLQNHSACDSIFQLMDRMIREEKQEALYLSFYFASKGVYFQRRSMPDSAMVVYKKALNDIPTTQKDYYFIKQSILYNLGIIEKKRKNFRQALHYYEEAQANLEQDTFSYKERFKIYYSIGLLYQHLGDYDFAMDFYDKALVEGQSSDFSKAKTYRNILEIHLLQEDTNNIKIIGDTLITLYDKVSYRTQCNLAYTLWQRAFFLGDYEIGEKYIELYRICLEDGKVNAEASYGIEAQYYDLVGQPKKALAFAKKSLAVIKKDKTNRLKSYANKLEAIIHLNIKTNAPKDSLLRYFTEYEGVRDTQSQKILSEEIKRWSVKYETRIKQDSINILQLQNQNQASTLKQRNLSLIGAILLAFLLASLAWLYRKYLKNEKSLSALLEKEKEQLIFEKQELNFINADLKEKNIYLAGQQKQRILANKLELKSTNKIHLIDPDTVTYIKAESDGCRLYFLEHSLWVEHPLKELLGEFPKEQFVRVFRSTIVNIQYIDFVNHTSLRMQDGTDFKISRTYKDEILRKIKN